MKKIPENEIDEQEVEKAIALLKNLINHHSKIKKNIWISAMYSILISRYIAWNISYKEFSKHWNEIKNCYKSYFEK